MSYQAVLWDFGGVITTSPFEAFNRYEAEHGLPLDFIRRINATNPDINAWAQFESSRIGIEEFDRLFLAESRAAGHPIPGRDVIALLSGDVRPRMVEVLRRCKQDFKIACLTNNVRAGHGPGMSSLTKSSRYWSSDARPGRSGGGEVFASPADMNEAETIQRSGASVTTAPATRAAWTPSVASVFLLTPRSLSEAGVAGASQRG